MYGGMKARGIVAKESVAKECFAECAESSGMLRMLSIRHEASGRVQGGGEWTEGDVVLWSSR